MENLEFNMEYFTDFYPDAVELFHKHNKEINLFNEELKINTEYYLNSEENGMLKIFTARDSGRLVGYLAFFLFTHSHHMDTIHAKQDVFYADKDYRGGLGRKLVQFSEYNLKRMGVKFIHQFVPLMNNWSQLLESEGYKEIEKVYLKEL